MLDNQRKKEVGVGKYRTVKRRGEVKGSDKKGKGSFLLAISDFYITSNIRHLCFSTFHSALRCVCEFVRSFLL